MGHRTTVRLATLIGLIMAAGVSFSIGFAGATLLTRTARSVNTAQLGTAYYDAEARNARAGVAADNPSTPAGSEELDAGATAVALVCLGILAIALLGMLRDRRKPASLVVARYSRRGSTRR